MKKKFIYLFIYLFIFISCKEKVVRSFYESGKLRTETFTPKKGKNSDYKSYFENGKLHMEGSVLEDGSFTGFWTEYYSDGCIKWHGEFKDGFRMTYEEGEIPDYDQLKTSLESQSKKNIQLGKPFSFRIYIEGVHPDSYMVTFDFLGKIEYNVSDTANYPYVISAQQIQKYYDVTGRDTLDICIHYPDENKDVIIGNIVRCILVPIDTISGNISD